MIFDTHAHYDDEAFDPDREGLLKSLHNQGIDYIVNVGASIDSIKKHLPLQKNIHLFMRQWVYILQIHKCCLKST